MQQRQASLRTDAELAQLKAELGRLTGLQASVQPAPVRAARMRGLRIRLRTFLDGHRRALPRSDATDLRLTLERLDKILAELEG
jgi:hypothetical protein